MNQDTTRLFEKTNTEHPITNRVHQTVSPRERAGSGHVTR